MRIRSSESKFLCHYTNKNAAILHILPHMRLKLNNLSKSNDPIESTPLVFLNIKSVLSIDEKFIENTNENYLLANNKMRESTKIVSFCQDYEVEDLDSILHGQGGYINRMWTQYGENHQGVCLEISRTLFEEENKHLLQDKSFKLEPIQYKNGKIFSLKHGKTRKDTITYFNSKEFIELNYKNYLFTKDHSWSTEHEFRVAKLSSDSDKDDYLSIKNSLIRILVGLNFPEDAMKTLKSVVENKAILIERINFNNNKLSSRRTDITY